MHLKPTTQKVVLLLAAGLALGLSGSPRHYFRILRDFKKDWNRINRLALHRSIKRLYKSRLIDAKDNEDGSTTIVLTKKGKEIALKYKIDEITIPMMKNWDKKWRLVLFDIPESKKKARDALSKKLKEIGFYKLQKSVFVHPFECENEVDFIIEFFQVRPFIRLITAEEINNELVLKKHFNLI